MGRRCRPHGWGGDAGDQLVGFYAGGPKSSSSDFVLANLKSWVADNSQVALCTKSLMTFRRRSLATRKH